jgi:hypothetical protein
MFISGITNWSEKKIALGLEEFHSDIEKSEDSILPCMRVNFHFLEK